MKTAAIIQARQTSSRLPGKALIDICGKPALQRVIERIRQSEVDDVIVACTINKADDVIVELCEKLDCKYFRGSEEDVLSRVLDAAKAYNIETIVEITADCPLIDWNHINQLLRLHGNGIAVDITMNIEKRTFPRGYDIRIFNTKTLEKVNKEVDNPIDRQHVSTWMYLNPKGKENYLTLNWLAVGKERRPDLEITLDTPEDYELICWLFAAAQEYRLDLTCEEVINLIDTYPYIYKKVETIKRKDYFEELNAYYESKKEPETNENESVDNGLRGTGLLGRRTGKRK